MKNYTEDLYHLLIDDIRETASVCIERDNQREIVFDRLDKLEKNNSELLEVAKKAQKRLDWYGMRIEGLDKAINKAKGDDE